MFEICKKTPGYITHAKLKIMVKKMTDVVVLYGYTECNIICL